jgi:hypothetical protein
MLASTQNAAEVMTFASVHICLELLAEEYELKRHVL